MNAARGAAALLLAAAAPRLAAAQTALTVTGFAASVEHRVTTGGVLEAAMGTVFGTAATVALGSVAVDATAAGGTLARSGGAGDNQRYAAVALRVALIPADWLALTAGLSFAAYDTPVARQRWTATRVGAEARLPFITGGLAAMGRVELLPTVSVTGLDRPELAFAAGTGLAWRGGPVTASLVYTLERFNFPPNGERRREQLGMLTAGLSVRLLGPPAPGP